MKEPHKIAIILLSTFVSGMGISSFFIAVNWFIEHIDNSSFYVALVNALCYLLVLIVLPHIGNLCDYSSRKKILVLIYSCGVVLQLLLCFIVNKASSFELLVVIICVTTIISVIRTTDQVCRTAYLQSVVSKKYYQLSNQWLEAIRQGITFIGGGVTALLMKSPSLTTILYFNIITFFIGLLLVLLLPKDTVCIPEKHLKKLSYIAKLKSGLLVLNGLERWSRIVILFSIVPYALVVALNVTYPIFFKELLIAHESQFYAALSIPYGSGALLASYLNKRVSTNFKRFFMTHCVIFIVALFWGVLIHNIYAVYCALFTIAYCHAAIRVQRNSFIMSWVNNKDIAKVLSFFEIIFTLLVIIMSFLLGFICDYFSSTLSWVFTAIVLLVSIILCGIYTTQNQTLSGV
ncbi:MAG TPA: MFS transporter [Burkholderiales bacterium]|nr:MFS transporter [Burkholderiales bacterium]